MFKNFQIGPSSTKLDLVQSLNILYYMEVWNKYVSKIILQIAVLKVYKLN